GPSGASRWRRSAVPGPAPTGRRDTRRGTSRRHVLDLGGLPDVGQHLPGALRFGAIDLRDGEADMHQHVVTDTRVRLGLQAHLPGDAAETDLADAQPVLDADLDDLSGNSEAHSATPSKCGNGRLSERQAAVIGWHAAMVEHLEAGVREQPRAALA